LKVDVGLVRGAVPDFERMFKQAQRQVKQRDRQLEQMRKRLSGRGKRPENETAETEELSYQALYESRIQQTSPDVAIGTARPFDLVGRLEIAALKKEGLKPTDTLVDLGCGSGRLAVHAIPYLAGGHYVGIDIAQALLDEAQKRAAETIPDPPCRVSWIHQTTPSFELDANSVDMICAFSVINHMEHEDSYLYLKEALRIVRPGGRFVFSCLPINTERARAIFLKSARVDLQTRYSRVRHVATSKDFMTDIARLAGWTPVRWYDGDEKNIQLDNGELHQFNQSICVLEAPQQSEASAELASANEEHASGGRRKARPL
jgi:ubiquinone/menaquinone biosynthesis C-methylase UbiE